MSQTNSRFQGGGVILPQGSSPGNINVGEKALIVDSDGTVKTQDSTGTKTSIGGGCIDVWATQQQAFLASKVPQLTRYFYQKLGTYNLGALSAATGNTATANMVGGGIQGPNGGLTVLGTDIIQDPRTYFAFCFRGILAVTITTKVATLGLVDAAGTSFLGVRSDFDTNTTKYLLKVQALTAAASTINNDGLIHDFAVTGDGTNIKLWIDTVDSGASIVQSTAGAAAMGGVIQNTTAGNAKASDFIFGVVAP